MKYNHAIETLEIQLGVLKNNEEVFSNNEMPEKAQECANGACSIEQAISLLQENNTTEETKEPND